MQRPGHHPGLTQLSRDAVGSHLGAGEDHGPALPVRDLGRDLVLVVRDHVQHVVGHGGHRRLAGVHLVGDRIGEVAPDQLVHRAIEGGGEQEPLPVRGHGVEDGGDGGQEPEIAHVVGLVENHHLHPAEVGYPLFQEVDQPAGRGHRHVHAPFEGLDLGAVGHAARHQVQAESHHGGQRGQVVGDLQGQLAGGGQYHCARSAGGLVDGQAGQQRQPECQGLAGTGAATAEHVAASDGVGDGGALDREWLRDALLFLGRHHGSGHAEFGETGGRVVIGDLHLDGGGLPAHLILFDGVEVAGFPEVAARLAGPAIVMAATLVVAATVRMFLTVPPGAAETPRAVVATEVPVEVAIPAPPFLSALVVVAATLTVAASEVVAATREPVSPVSTPLP